ncbi:MAG: ATP-binding protein [candidate division WOR-3 bacterium]
MSDFIFSPPQNLTVDPRLITQLSNYTIRSVTDALVELITNSDDSYRKLEEAGIVHSGRIEISLVNKKEQPSILLVRDYAEGISRERLSEISKFGAKTSGFYEGSRVRGFFGRGLKEAIVALGKGEVFSIQNNNASCAKIETIGSTPQVSFSDSIEASTELRKKYGILSGNGTVVTIEITNPIIKCPTLETIFWQLKYNYALEHVLISNKRTVVLQYKCDSQNKRPGAATGETKQITFVRPKGEKILDDELRKIPQYGDSIRITLFESDEPLFFPYEPFSNKRPGVAGIRIKTEGVYLDNTLFRFQEEAGRYFWGYAEIDGIAQRLRKREEGILDLNRAGLRWQNDYCKAIKCVLERILEQHIIRKQKQLNADTLIEINPDSAKRLNKACNLLNKIAKDELEEDGPQRPQTTVNTFCLFPASVNVPLGKLRTISIYLPKSQIEELTTPITVDITTDNNLIPIITYDNDGQPIPVTEARVDLREHSSIADVYFGDFKIRGDLKGEETKLTARLGSLIASCNAKVADLKRKRPQTKGGMFREIKAKYGTGEIFPRVAYDSNTGTVWIYINFPGIAGRLSDGLPEINTPEGGMLCAELLLEVLCSVIVQKKYEIGIKATDISVPGVFREIQSLQRKYMKHIYDIFVKK